MAWTQSLRGARMLAYSISTLRALFLLLCLTAVKLVAAQTIVTVAEASAGLAFSESEVDAYAAQLRQQFLADVDSHAQRGCSSHCEQIARVWRQLLPTVQAQQGRTLAKPTLIVVQADTVDALSFAEGTIVLSEPFVVRMDLDDAQLAFVLAHEVAHVLLQHERQTLTSVMALLPGPCARSASDCYSQMGERYFVMDEYFALIAQQTEFEADEVGFHLAALAGFAPRQQLGFMQKLARAGPQQSMLSTHPQAAQRLSSLQQRMPLATRLFERSLFVEP